MITFQNPGEIDLRAVTFMGVSVKENDSPIGYFGTGLKYAVATLLRTGHMVSLYVGTTEHKFGVREELVRGRPFNLIYMNEAPLGITTELGKNWEPWQAYRELHSNALDEQGHTYYGRKEPSEGTTTICVVGDGIDAAFRDRGKIFLQSTPLWSDGSIEIHEKVRSAGLFYRGVKATADYSQPYEFTYNVLMMSSLTEDRTLKDLWTAHWNIAHSLAVVDDELLLRRILSAGKDSWEAKSCDFSHSSPNEMFLRIVGEMKGKVLNPSALSCWIKSAKGVERYTEHTLTPFEIKLFERAKRALIPLGFDAAKYPIRFSNDLGGGSGTRLGVAEKGEIWLSTQLFGQGAKQIASTLYEEWVHLETSLNDCDYSMQTFLFNKIISLVEEHYLGEPI